MFGVLVFEVVFLPELPSEPAAHGPGAANPGSGEEGGPRREHCRQGAAEGLSKWGGGDGLNW